MSYRETIEYLFNQLPMYQRIGAAAYKADLDNTKAICSILGNPEKKFRSVHIAGTNGKGSASNYLASVFREAGYKTGLFTSPHLKDFRERIRVNGRMVSKKYVIDFFNKYQHRFEDIQPSFFEWTFGLAASYFADLKVDIAILETGMGGRLDSTNVVVPELSVITNIGLDHVQFLGDTLEKIAFEKAGIIKENIPVVIGETQEGPDRVFLDAAHRNNSYITFADQKIRITRSGLTKSKHPMLFVETGDMNEGQSFRILSPLTGAYQLKNLVTVLQAVKVLQSSGFQITEKNLRNGIRRVTRNTSFIGRWQILGYHPLVVADIGHNKEGIHEVVAQIEKTTYDKLHFILGVAKDKDIRAILSQLPLKAEYYFCKADIPRGMDAGELCSLAAEYNLHGEAYPSVQVAFLAASKNAGSNDFIFIGGSAFVVAEIL